MPVTGKLLLNAPLAEQNHMKKASEIAVIAIAFNDSKSVSKLDTYQFDRKLSFSAFKQNRLKSSVFKLLMNVENTIHISPIFSVCASNFLNRYFVNAICTWVYFFQNLSMVGIFFTSPHSISFKYVAPKFKL